MTIRWMAADAMSTALSSEYPPPGLVLYPAFHATFKDRSLLPRWIGAAPEIGEHFPGLGSTEAWAGLFRDVPFSVMSTTDSNRVRMTVSFPIRAALRRALDASLLDLLALFPVRIYENSIYFEGLPFEGPGYGVLQQFVPVFQSASNEEAEEVQRFLTQRANSGRFVVAPIGASPLAWIVAGPQVCGYISRYEKFQSRKTAILQAQSWSAQLQGAFTVYEGGLGRRVVETFESGNPILPDTE